jgi:hypothetical protein
MERIITEPATILWLQTEEYELSVRVAQLKLTLILD